LDPRKEFQDLALTHLDSMYSYALLLTRDDWEADDLLQEALLRGFRSFGSFDARLSFKAWLFKIIKNAYIDRWRRLRGRPGEEEWQGEDGVPKDPTKEVLLYPVPLNPEEILLRRLAVEEVRGAIRQLPVALREVVELREIEGLSYHEIAEVLGKPIGTVMSRLSRGRNLVRSHLQEPPAEGLRSRTAYGL
jgi:RNA polymerase sigma-70 factor (ECF subfamily)